MLWTWRKHAPSHSTRRTLLPLIMSIVTFCAFGIAGVFSSRVATTRGGEVLLTGDKCATLNSSLIGDQNVALMQTYITNRIRVSTSYASTCYTDSSSADSCRTFIRNTLSLKVTPQVACPFPGKDQICRSPEGALRLDSGLLDSHFDLGINSPPSQRFLYRTVNECAPLKSHGFTRPSSTATLKTIQHLYGEDKFGRRNGSTFESIDQRDYGPNIRGEYSLEYVLLPTYGFLGTNRRALVLPHGMPRQIQVTGPPLSTRGNRSLNSCVLTQISVYSFSPQTTFGSFRQWLTLGSQLLLKHQQIRLRGLTD